MDDLSFNAERVRKVLEAHLPKQPISVSRDPLQWKVFHLEYPDQVEVTKRLFYQLVRDLELTISILPRSIKPIFHRKEEPHYLTKLTIIVTDIDKFLRQEV